MVARSTAPAVLVADAEPYICRVFEAKLSKDNQFQVTSASTGLEAFQAALRQPFDVILWDMRLRETARLLPSLRALCPVASLLLMTTDDRPMLGPETDRLDVADVLVKPFGLDTLVERVRASLSAPHSGGSVARVDLAVVGQQLTIRSPGGLCVTRVLESGTDTFTVVSAPRVETPEDFAPGVHVQVEVNGSDALYTFASRLNRLYPTPVPRWELRLPRTIHRAQRRLTPRLSLHLPVVLRPEASDAGELFNTIEAASGVLEDINRDGFALISDTPLPVGAQVAFDLHDMETALTGIGTVLRLEPLPGATSTGTTLAARYHIALQFTALTSTARRRLRALLASRP